MHASLRLRRIPIWLLAAALLCQIVLPASLPSVAHAATSADTNAEIIYVDSNGVVRVWDFQGTPPLEWNSPDGGWEYVSLGDVNNDTDLEIVAMGQAGNDVKVAVFDPVVARGASQTTPRWPTTGIPWATLYTFPPIPGIARFVEVGNFDPAVPGEEIAIGYRDAANNHYVGIWKAASLGTDGNPTGRDWTVHIAPRVLDVKGAVTRYEYADSGQLDADATDELFLLDEDSEKRRADIRQPDANLDYTDGKSSDSVKYSQVAIGQIIADGPDEIALRIGSSSSVGMIVYEVVNEGGIYEMDTDEDWSWTFSPQPDFIFLADLTGNGDKELLFLRQLDDRSGARLIMRDDWGSDRDSHRVDIEEDLDDDDSFRRGAGADVDGDGKDEIIIMNDRLIRVYRDPDASMGSNTITEFISPTGTNRETLEAGDLDTIGFLEGPQFGVNKQLIEGAVPVGTAGNSTTLQVTNAGSGGEITFNVTISGGAWATVDRSIATTPTTLNINFDARNLQVGNYSAELTLIATTSGVIGSPLKIPIELEVLPATILPNPTIASLMHYPCSAPLEPMTVTVDIGGTNDLNFRGAVIAVPDATAASVAALGNGAPVAGYVDAAGSLVLTDAAGNARTIPQPVPPSGGVAIAATQAVTWPVDAELDWIVSVTADDTAVPTKLEIAMDPTALGADFPLTQAVFVMVPDTRAGNPPQSVTILPIVALCVDARLQLPVLLQPAVTR
jgi:hypothetical protein